MLRRSLPALATLGLLISAAASAQTDFVPVTDAMLEHPAPGDWLHWRRTQDGWAFSPLTEISARNVKNLKQVWTKPMGSGPQEATPLVYNGVMYLPNRGDFIQAFDGATGNLRWEYHRVFPQGMQGGTNRSLAIWGTTLIDAGGDNQIYAVDARTGKLVWETPVHAPQVRAHATAGPIIAGGKVITGRQCQPDATFEGCVVTAHDAATVAAEKTEARFTGKHLTGGVVAAVQAARSDGFDAMWYLRKIFENRHLAIKAGCGWLPGDWLFEDGLRRALRVLATQGFVWPRPSSRVAGTVEYAFRHDLVREGVELAGEKRRHDVEAVGGAGLEPAL